MQRRFLDVLWEGSVHSYRTALVKTQKGWNASMHTTGSLQKWEMKFKCNLQKMSSTLSHSRCKSLFLHLTRFGEILHYINCSPNGSSAVNGCRRNESKLIKKSHNNPQVILFTPVHQWTPCEKLHICQEVSLSLRCVQSIASS